MLNEKKPALANGNTLEGAYPPGTKWDMDIPVKTLLDVFDESTSRYAHNNFIDFLGKKYSYEEIGQLVNKAAKGFQNIGVKKGTKVGLFMPNTPYSAIMFFGALKAGAAVVNFDSSYDKDQLRQQIEDSETDIMVTMSLKTEETQFYPKLEALIKEGVSDDFKVVVCPMKTILPFPKSWLYPLLKRDQITKTSDSNAIRKHVVQYDSFINNDGKFKHVDVTPDDLAVLQYTGGTTGAPKGAMLSHFNLVANIHQISEFQTRRPGQIEGTRMPESGKERVLGAIPKFHVFGMNVSMIFTMKEGNSILMLPNPRDIKTIAQTIAGKKPTIIPFIPRHIRALLDYMAAHPQEKIDFSDVKIVMSGGAALSPDLTREFETKTGCRIIQGYGLSETSPVVCSHHTLMDNNDPDSVGLPYPRTEIMISEIGKDEGFTPAAAGETGEICIKGPQVMQGYWKKPEENKSILKDGWFRTGDIGRIDTETGQVYITDRLKDMGTINGENVYSQPIEKQILEHPDIAECNIIFIKDDRSGEAAVAFIRLKPGVTFDEKSLREFFDKSGMPKLNKPKYLNHWTASEELPKTNVGKPDKKALRKIALALIEKGSLPSSTLKI